MMFDSEVWINSKSVNVIGSAFVIFLSSSLESVCDTDILWTSQLTRSYSATGPKGVSAILRGEACHITWNKKRNWMNLVQFIQESLFLWPI